MYNMGDCMKAAQIENGVVINIIEVPSLDYMPNLVDPVGAKIGNLWDGFNFTQSPSQILEDEIRTEETEKNQLKAQSILDNIPSWSEVENDINSISDLDEVKTFIKKLARVVYWDVKDQED